MKYVLIFIFFLFYSLANSQAKIDSLESKLSTLSQLEDKIEVISELITLYDDNPEGELYLKSLVNLVQNSSFEFQEKAFKVAYQYYSKRENKS